MLDANMLGFVCHPRSHEDVREWMDRMLAGGRHSFVVPEISDYEERREYLRAGFHESVLRLDSLARYHDYARISTNVMLRAAQLWAQARLAGMPTAHAKNIDADVILAAQAIEERCVVVTENVGHLGRYCDARPWRSIE